MQKIQVPVLAGLLGDPAGEREGGESLVAALYRLFLGAIRAGRIAEGVVLPSSRAAAAGLGLSRNTINAVYDLLRAEGLIEIRAGAFPQPQRPGREVDAGQHLEAAHDRHQISPAARSDQ